MASTNQSPFYQRAEQEFHKATTDEQRIECIKVMIKECPKHKSSENMLRNLTNRLKKLETNVEKQKRSGKSNQIGIKKADMQGVLVGFPNTGKSTIFKNLTNQEVKISEGLFTTQTPQLGTFKFEDAQIQIIDIPSFPNHDQGLVNSTDTLLLVIDNLDQIKKSEEFLYRTKAKLIVLYNKEDLLLESDKRKIESTLKSKFKNYKYLFFSLNPTKIELDKLKKTIFETFPIIRVYTKEPKKEASIEPMILKKNSTLEDVAEKILKGMSKKIKRARIWGPSSKFGGQIIGLSHQIQDKDIIEFQTI